MPNPSPESWSSMTSFAQIEKEHNETLYKIQAKSVNHRFFDIKLRAGREWQMKENDIKAWLKSELHRGSVEIWIDTSKPNETDETESQEKLDRFLSKLDSAVQSSDNNHPRLNETPWITPLTLALNRDAWWQEESNSAKGSSIEDCDELKSWFQELAEKMNAARQKEGAQTQAAISDITGQLRKNLNSVTSEVNELNALWEKNIHERIEKLSERLQQEPPESSRIYQEFVILADKKDVSEELQRIDSHLNAVEELVHKNKEKQVGKKLDFCAQELNREFTTLNNKIQNPELGKRLGDSKLLIEKIREQCLNLV